MICLSLSGPHGDIQKKQLVTLSDQVPQTWVIHTLLQALPRLLAPSLDRKAADFCVLSFEKQLITDVHMGIIRLCLVTCNFSSCEELIGSACIKSTGLLTSLVIPGCRIS